MSDDVVKVMCVEHRQGWCALKPGVELDQEAMADPTACGRVVTMRLRSKVRTPDCVDCLKAMEG